MTALQIMPSDYGMEMLIGSSPVFGSGFLGTGNPSGYPEYSHYAPLWSSGVSCSSESVTTITAPSRGASLPISIPCMAPSTVFGGGFSRTNTTRRSLGADGSFRRRKVSTVVPPPLQQLKSCLISKVPLDATLEEETTLSGAISPSREKKKVSFADMQGQTLTQIKIITERPDCPPRWSSDFLEQVTGGAKAEALSDQWKVTFSQPASDYIGFKNHLERNNVALENVVIRDAESLISGTIKVRNISFHKKVAVRFTTDNWSSYDESPASYVSSPVSGSSYNIYDTFTFSFPLPSTNQADKIEFCVFYESDGLTFWDNNSNKNYTIILFRPNTNEANSNAKPREVCDISMESWSEFSAWKNLSLNESPYW